MIRKSLLTLLLPALSWWYKPCSDRSTLFNTSHVSGPKMENRCAEKKSSKKDLGFFTETVIFARSTYCAFDNLRTICSHFELES